VAWASLVGIATQPSAFVLILTCRFWSPPDSGTPGTKAGNCQGFRL